MKKLTLLILFIAIILTLSACSQQNSNSQNDVLQNEAQLDEGLDLFSPDSTPEAQLPPTVEELAPIENGNAQEGHVPETSAEILAAQQELALGKNFDIDLTTMSSTMVYSQIYDVMVNYNNYLDKSINLVGTFSTMYYDEIAQTLNFVVINDATGCCPQGLELKFAEDVTLPAADATIGIQGRFTTYFEGEFEYFCILVEQLTVY